MRPGGATSGTSSPRSAVASVTYHDYHIEVAEVIREHQFTGADMPRYLQSRAGQGARHRCTKAPSNLLGPQSRAGIETHSPSGRHCACCEPDERDDRHARPERDEGGLRGKAGEHGA